MGAKGFLIDCCYALEWDRFQSIPLALKRCIVLGR
jgi:hypothetical protein